MGNRESESYISPKDAEYFPKVVAHAEARERARLVERLLGHLNYEGRREYLTNLIRGVNK